jgi:hypothetical protein
MAVALLPDLDETAGTAGAPRRARSRTWLRRIGGAFAILVLLALSLVALGAGVGRYHAVPVGPVGAGVHVSRGDLAILSPTSPLQLRDGDVVMARAPHTSVETLYKLTVVDSWSHEVYTTDAHNHLVKLQMKGQAARLSRTIPYAGTPFGWLDGELQGILLLGGALLVGIRIGSRRRYYSRMAELQRISLGVQNSPPRRPRRPGFLNASWATRLAAVSLAMVGMFSLTASANFGTTGTTVTQGAITAGHLQFSLGSASSTYRLQTGVTAMAPGDVVERAVDVQVDGSTSSSILTGINLQVVASSNTAGSGSPANTYYLDDTTAYSLRIWILGCSGGVWTTTDTPPYHYTACSSGSVQDILGTYHANNASLPASNTCPYTGAVTLNAAESSTALTNVNTTAGSHNYWMVVTCMPTAANDTNQDNYQDASLALTYNFTGVQRAATSK